MSNGLRLVADVFICSYFAVMTVATWCRHPVWQHVQREREISQCSQNLLELHEALQDYRQEHGSFPKRLDPLYPQYIRDVRRFVCPATVAAVRLGRAGYTVRAGGHSIRSAYMLSYLTEDYSQILARRRGSTPVLICPEHVQKTAETVYGQIGGEGFERRHGDPPYLIVRQNGTVDRLGCLAAWRRKLHNSNEF